MRHKKPYIAVLYNQVGEDEYEALKSVDPSSLDFKPEYAIDVATVSEEYKAIVAALSAEGFRVVAANIEDRLNKLHTILKREHPDAVFNLIEHFHDDPKKEHLIAGLYDLYEVPYTGAPPFTLALCQRKAVTKQLLLANGVPTPRFRLLVEPHIPRRHGLHYPLIVKPAREDASVGVDQQAVVYDLDQLLSRIDAMFKEFPPPILVEEFIEGRELHVSILGNNPPKALPILEYDFSELPPEHPAIISYNAKWDPLKEEYHRIHSVCPAKLSKAIARRVMERALQAYRITNCRDYARIDLRLSKENKAYVLEVNPNPDLTEGVSFMESAEKAGLSFSKTLRKIVEFALSRKKQLSEVSSQKPEVRSQKSEVRNQKSVDRGQ